MRKGQRTVSALNGSVAASLVTLLAFVALVVKPPSPPGIAEFAPQAAKPISKAPLGQTSGFVSGGTHSCRSGVLCPLPASPDRPPLNGRAPAVPSGPPPGVPSALQCYRWPDGSVTQTFDPQSPPCVATWDEAAGNGGATSQGVSGSEIRVAVDDVIVKYDSEQSRNDIAALAAFFNAHFQLYGRKLRIVYYHSADSGPYLEGDPNNQVQAAKSAGSLAPFAATDFWDSTTSPKIFWTQLSRERVIATAAEVIGSSSKEYDDLAPYVWTYGMPYDALERNQAAFVCTSLPASGGAAYAGADVKGKPRKFAVVVPYTDGGVPTPDTKPLRDALSACGVTAPVFTMPNDNGDRTGATDTLFFKQLHDDGFTSLLPFGYSGQVRGMPDEAGWGGLRAGVDHQRGTVSAGRLPLAGHEAHAAVAPAGPGQLEQEPPPRRPALVRGIPLREPPAAPGVCRPDGGDLPPTTGDRVGDPGCRSAAHSDHLWQRADGHRLPQPGGRLRTRLPGNRRVCPPPLDAAGRGRMVVEHHREEPGAGKRDGAGSHVRRLSGQTVGGRDRLAARAAAVLRPQCSLLLITSGATRY